jgi:hypothetical protein
MGLRESCFLPSDPFLVTCAMDTVKVIYVRIYWCVNDMDKPIENLNAGNTEFLTLTEKRQDSH